MPKLISKQYEEVCMIAYIDKTNILGICSDPPFLVEHLKKNLKAIQEQDSLTQLRGSILPQGLKVINHKNIVNVELIVGGVSVWQQVHFSDHP
jgi:hypothetical protein